MRTRESLIDRDNCEVCAAVNRCECYKLGKTACDMICIYCSRCLCNPLPEDKHKAIDGHYVEGDGVACIGCHTANVKD